MVDISQHLMKLKPGFSVRDLLVDLQNYFLEATVDGFRIMPDQDSIRDVEEIQINLGQSFSSFGLPVVAMQILPDEDIEPQEVVADALSIPSVSSSTIMRDADGVERILLNFK